MSDLENKVYSAIHKEIIDNQEAKPYISTPPNRTDISSLFYNASTVGISIHDYIKRVITYSGCEENTYRYALKYLARIKERNDSLSLCEQNVNRLFIASLLVAAKYVEDEIYPASYWAKVGGLPSVDEMNMLELEFLKFLNFDLSVTTEELDTIF